MERVAWVGVPLYWGGVQKSYQGHMKVKLDKKNYKKYQFCAFQRALRVS